MSKDQQLHQRVITAAILIPVTVAAIFLPPSLFNIVSAVIMLLAAGEWFALSERQASDAPAPFPQIRNKDGSHIYRVLLLCLLILFDLLPTLAPTILLFLTSLFWVGAAVLVLTYHKTKHVWKEAHKLILGAGLLIFVACGAGLNLMHGQSQGPLWVLYFLVLIWGADIAAYFAGRHYGRKKLAPEISPKKTWEGVYGALAAGVVLALVASLVLHKNVFAMVLLALVTVSVSIVGDLTESALKRNAQVKDSGWIVRGHGGVLDRIDSLLAAAPFFALGCWLISP